MQLSNEVQSRGRTVGRSRVLFSALAGLCLSLGASAALAQQTLVFKESPAYKAVPLIASDQAQIVLYRMGDALPTTKAVPGANVYVDQSFHNSLPPHSYTRFCVKPGVHSIEAYANDAPAYPGKTAPKSEVILEGGKTYFAAIAEDNSGAPLPYRREDLERLLSGTSQPHHVLNRSKSVVTCNEVAQVEVPAPVAARKVYTLSADVVFPFGKGDYASITPAGHEAIKTVAKQIQQESVNAELRLTVRGHADPIGSVAGNKKLSTQRANSVARALQEAGLPRARMRAEGVGSAETVVSCGNGPATKDRIECNAPNRRVEVVADPVR